MRTWHPFLLVEGVILDAQGSHPSQTTKNWRHFKTPTPKTHFVLFVSDSGLSVLLHSRTKRLRHLANGAMAGFQLLLVPLASNPGAAMALHDHHGRSAENGHLRGWVVSSTKAGTTSVLVTTMSEHLARFLAQSRYLIQ